MGGITAPGEGKDIVEKRRGENWGNHISLKSEREKEYNGPGEGSL